MRRVIFSMVLMLCAVAGPAAAQDPSAVSAWVAAPAAGATWAAAYVELRNPSMYDVYVVSAEAPGTAAAVELRAAASGGAEAAVIRELTVPAYGGTEAEPAAPHLRLVGLTRPLAAGDVVDLSLKTDRNVELKVKAEVRK